MNGALNSLCLFHSISVSVCLTFENKNENGRWVNTNPYGNYEFIVFFRSSSCWELWISLALALACYIHVWYGNDSAAATVHNTIFSPDDLTDYIRVCKTGRKRVKERWIRKPRKYFVLRRGTRSADHNCWELDSLYRALAHTWVLLSVECRIPNAHRN